MNSKLLDHIPYAVSWVFSDDGNVNHGINMLVAPDESMAVGIVVATYHQQGGTLPLLAVKACAISEEMARAAVKVYDDIAARNNAEADKVVQPKFGVVEGTGNLPAGTQTGFTPKLTNTTPSEVNQLTGPDWKPPS